VHNPIVCERKDSPKTPTESHESFLNRYEDADSSQPDPTNCFEGDGFPLLSIPVCVEKIRKDDIVVEEVVVV